MLRKMEGGDGGAQRSGTWRRTDRPLPRLRKAEAAGQLVAGVTAVDAGFLPLLRLEKC